MISLARFGHCARCGVSVPKGCAMCSRCNDGTMRLMQALASQTRRDRRIWEQRRRIALGCYLTALFLGAVTIGPSVDHGDAQGVLFAIAVPAAVVIIGRMIQPKNRRPL